MNLRFQASVFCHIKSTEFIIIYSVSNYYKSVNHVIFSWNFVIRTQLTITIFVYRIWILNYCNF
jgi:hypothetical protein